MSLDGALRRRLYLFRHGAVDYVDASGNVVPDPDAVTLNPKGRDEAQAMHSLFADVPVDRAICSGLNRTRETAKLVLTGREIDVETDAGFEEIRPATERRPDYDLFRDVAYTHWQADVDGSRFLGGERYVTFYDRIAATMERIVADPEWHNIAVFAHGGTNAAILGWVTGLGLNAFGVFDQATCCLNVIDFDVETERGGVLRKVVRGMNITAADPTKMSRHSGDMEALARYLMSFDR
jgi:probable phosphoglycerate mutase